MKETYVVELKELVDRPKIYFDDFDNRFIFGLIFLGKKILKCKHFRALFCDRKPNIWVLES